MRRYYDRFRRRRRGVGFLPKVILIICALVALFLYRDSILGWLDDNPTTAQYVPEFVTSALERDLEDWKEEDLQARYQQLSAEMQTWQSKLESAASQGQAKFEEVQTNVSETKAALDETKAALDKLSEAGANLKGSVSTNASSPDSE
jgi:hypothetical protein